MPKKGQRASSLPEKRAKMKKKKQKKTQNNNTKNKQNTQLK